MFLARAREGVASITLKPAGERVFVVLVEKKLSDGP
jgi:hypothetical protein